MTQSSSVLQADEERVFSDPSECLGVASGTSNRMNVPTLSDSFLSPVLPEDVARLMATGSVLLPGDAGYDDERAVWNLTHELVPAVIVVPESAADVQAAVTFAAGQHRPILAKATGHQVVGRAHQFSGNPRQAKA
jgi:hypothetical protein